MHLSVSRDIIQKDMNKTNQISQSTEPIALRFQLLPAINVGEVNRWLPRETEAEMILLSVKLEEVCDDMLGTPSLCPSISVSIPSGINAHTALPCNHWCASWDQLWPCISRSPCFCLHHDLIFCSSCIYQVASAKQTHMSSWFISKKKLEETYYWSSKKEDIRITNTPSVEQSNGTQNNAEEEERQLETRWMRTGLYTRHCWALHAWSSWGIQIHTTVWQAV